MSAPLGNRFWEQRSSHGRKPIFASPEDMWNAACEYFIWVEENPLNEEKLFAYQGVVTKESCTKMRAMTIQGLCLFLDISDESWANYKKQEGFFGITSNIEKVIYQQKFSGAAADLLNANIIARELGLKDSTIQETKGELIVKTARDYTDDELAAIAARSSERTSE